MLTLEEIAYGQQKNREYIYEESKEKSKEILGRYDWQFIDTYYERLCNLANITPW